MKKAWGRWVWLAAGAVVIALIFYNLSRSPEWSNFRWDRLWRSMVGARIDYLLMAVVLVYSTFFVRAIRWRFFMAPIKAASLWVLFVGQILGFSAIFLVGRPGEFVRPAYIAKKENVSMSAMIAVWLLERVLDTIAMVVLFAAALYFEPVNPDTAQGVFALHEMHKWGHVLFGLTGLLILGLVLFRRNAAGTTAAALKLFRFLPERALRHFAHFLHSFGEGLSVIRDWKGLAGSVVTTAVLWAINTTVFWLVFKSVRHRLGHLPWLAAGLTLFCAALGLIVQFPGIGGGYQVGVILSLTQIFNVAVEPATGASILIWLVMSVPCLVLGLILLIHEGLSIRKLEAIADEEKQEVTLEDT
ncbi:MAG TPA: lysylphosphatidylglycerol synthase transmembrane domain-containing protein [Terriglobia bacterium]|nr:lysylphosphatidylglycerol synthase transmembrane domain-containing protein [Terriglobia bacterium]